MATLIWLKVCQFFYFFLKHVLGTSCAMWYFIDRSFHGPLHGLGVRASGQLQVRAAWYQWPVRGNTMVYCCWHRAIAVFPVWLIKNLQCPAFTLNLQQMFTNQTKKMTCVLYKLSPSARREENIVWVVRSYMRRQPSPAWTSQLSVWKH